VPQALPLEGAKRALRLFRASDRDDLRIHGSHIHGARWIACAFGCPFASRFLCTFMVADNPGSVLMERMSPRFRREVRLFRNAISQISVVRVDQW
jgi:hypothetical protein